MLALAGVVTGVLVWITAHGILRALIITSFFIAVCVWLSRFRRRD